MNMCYVPSTLAVNMPSPGQSSYSDSFSLAVINQRAAQEILCFFFVAARASAAAQNGFGLVMLDLPQCCSTGLTWLLRRRARSYRLLLGLLLKLLGVRRTLPTSGPTGSHWGPCHLVVVVVVFSRDL